MTIDTAAEILSRAIQVILITSLPSVGLGLLIGLIVAIVQAVTQIQEQTLTFLPKMVVVFLVVSATFPWMAATFIELTVSLFQSIPIYSR